MKADEGGLGETFGILLGREIKERREQRSLTQAEVADEAFDPGEKLESYTRRLRDLEAGRYANPQAKTYQPVCDFLGITREFISELKQRASECVEPSGEEREEPQKGDVDASDESNASSGTKPERNSVWQRLNWPAITGTATVATIVVGLLGIWLSDQEAEFDRTHELGLVEPVHAASERLRVLAYPQDQPCLFWGNVIGYGSQTIEVAFDYGGVEKIEPTEVFEAIIAEATEAERLAVKLPLEGSSAWIETALIETGDGQLQALITPKVRECTEGLRGTRFNVVAEDVIYLGEVGVLK